MTVKAKEQTQAYALAVKGKPKHDLGPPHGCAAARIPKAWFELTDLTDPARKVLKDFSQPTGGTVAGTAFQSQFEQCYGQKLAPATYGMRKLSQVLESLPDIAVDWNQPDTSKAPVMTIRAVKCMAVAQARKVVGEFVDEKGGSVDAMDLFRTFRGAEPNIEPLLVRRGLN